MMYTLDLSGHDAGGKAGIDRFGGLFLSVDHAVTHGELAARSGRLPFVPEVLWVRDEEGEAVYRKKIGEDGVDKV